MIMEMAVPIQTKGSCSAPIRSMKDETGQLFFAECLITLDFSDPLIKHLYWKNLLKKSPDGMQLIWRCGLLREIGLRILG